MLAELARFFLWLGLTAFGGPAAHIAIMQRELVERKKWLSEREFLDLVSLSNLIPGPNSTELAMHVGFRRGGWQGLWVAGLCFILPGVLITLGLAGWFLEHQSHPLLKAAFEGMRPVIAALILHAVQKLFDAEVPRNWKYLVFFAVVLCASVAVPPAALVLVPAFAYVLYRSRQRPVDSPSKRALGLLALVAVVAAGLAWVGIRNDLPQTLGIFTGFAKIGATLYGSGYTLISFVDGEFVQRLMWMTPAELADGITIGQMTPGPVFSAATYFGYQMGGSVGAIAATAGVFLPAFLLVGNTAPRWQALTEASGFRDFLKVVNLVSILLMLLAILIFTPEDFSAGWIAVFAVAFALAFTKLNPTWMLLGGAVVGMAVSQFGGRF
jgi:chromate transporter